MKQISGMDDFFLHFERSGLPMHVGSVAIYQPPTSGEHPPGFSEIREGIRRGVARAGTTTAGGVTNSGILEDGTIVALGPACGALAGIRAR